MTARGQNIRNRYKTRKQQPTLMRMINISRLAFLLLLAFSMLALPVLAGAPLPDIPKGKGDKCVEETDLMRRDHMEMLFHQRDETTYRGIRTKKHSLKECIKCHVVKDQQNHAVSASNPKHFCRACHDYSSVSIDCFECHASKPKKRKIIIGRGL